jgi:hypothetical protein
LNSRFSNYGHWKRYYKYNPDRWYYDRFIALERILGPRIYVVYYQRYYRNYNPIVYYQNYRVKHYRPTVYVNPRYRNVDVRTLKMMLTEQEVSEIMIERIMTIETSRNLEKIQVLDQVHLMKDQEIMVDLEAQILEMIITETTGTKINNRLEMKASEAFLLKEVKTKTEEMTQ